MSEKQEQIALFKVFELHKKKFPELSFAFHPSNGEYRKPETGALLKKMGLKAGVPDIFIPAPRGNSHGLFVELKAKGGRVSDKQRAMMAGLAECGYACLVAYGWREAWDEIEKYLKSKEVLICNWKLKPGHAV